MKNLTPLLCLLIFFVGLHIPKSNTLLFVFGLIIAATQYRSCISSVIHCRVELLLALSFSILYFFISWAHLLWRFNRADLLESLAFLVLPPLLLFAGFIVSRSGHSNLRDILISYVAGCSLYFLISLILTLVFRLQTNPSLQSLALMRVPWGSVTTINIRSIEQTISISASWFLPLILYFSYTLNRRSSLTLLLLGLFGILSGIILRSRLVGFSCLGTTTLSILYLKDYFPNIPRIRRLFQSYTSIKILSVILFSLSISFLLGRGPFFQRLISRIYDERIDRTIALIGNLSETLLGGQSVSFSFFDLQRNALFSFDSAKGDLMHNVFLDVLVRVGIVPTVLLLILILLLLRNAFASINNLAHHASSIQHCVVLVAFIVVILFQWLFQPLIYSDQLFFFMTFFVLGSMDSRSSSSLHLSA